MKRLILILMIILGILPSVRAQSDDQDALLNTVFRAVAKISNADSLITESTYYSRSDVSVSQGEDRQTTFEESTLISHTQGTVGEDANGFSERTLTKVSRQNDTEVSGEIQAELLYVNGVLYARAINLAEKSELPDAWEIVGDPANYPQLEDLAVDDFVETLQGTTYNPFDDTELIENLLEEVISEEVELDDGTPAQHIQMVFDALALPRFLRNDPDFAESDLTSILFSVLDPESQLTLDVYLDENGEPLAWGSTFYLLVDHEEVSSGSQTFIMDIEIESDQFVHFVEINPELEPYAAP